MKKTKRHTLLSVLLLTALIGTGNKTYAQDNCDGAPVVQTLQLTKLHPVLFDVWIYGAGSEKKHPNLWTSNNNSYHKNDLYDSFVNIGLEAEAYKHPLLRLNASAGYKYERYAYDSGLWSSEGVYSHWLSTSLGMNFWIFKAGILSDIYLGSRIKNSDNFKYEGLYGECFNRASFAFYTGVSIQFGLLKAEGRIGSYLKPQLNPDKIAQYNLHKTHVNGLYWEVKLAYRLFTSGKHFTNNDMLKHF